MGFLVGATCFAPSPPLTLHSSPSTSQFLLLRSRNVAISKRRRPTSASLRRQDANDDDVSVRRRDFVLMGVSVLPFLQFRSPAMADESELSAPKSRVLPFCLLLFILVIILFRRRQWDKDIIEASSTNWGFCFYQLTLLDLPFNQDTSFATHKPNFDPSVSIY